MVSHTSGSGVCGSNVQDWPTEGCGRPEGGQRFDKIGGNVMAYQFDKMAQEAKQRDQSVGFEPGRLGVFPAWFTKMDFQRRLHSEFYGEEYRKTFFKYPLFYMFFCFMPLWTMAAVASFLLAWYMMIGFIFENKGIGPFFGVIFSLIMWAVWGYIFLWKYFTKLWYSAIALHLTKNGPATPYIIKAADGIDYLINTYYYKHPKP